METDDRNKKIADIVIERLHRLEYMRNILHDFKSFARNDKDEFLVYLLELSISELNLRIYEMKRSVKFKLKE